MYIYICTYITSPMWLYSSRASNNFSKYDRQLQGARICEHDFPNNFQKKFFFFSFT